MFWVCVDHDSSPLSLSLVRFAFVLSRASIRSGLDHGLPEIISSCFVLDVIIGQVKNFFNLVQFWQLVCPKFHYILQNENIIHAYSWYTL